MANPDLRVVPRATADGPPSRGDRPAPALAVALAVTALACALAATWLGADRARRPVDIRARAAELLNRSMELGNRHPEVQAELTDLRREIGRRPLESRRRTVYAATLLGLSRSMDDARAAAFHAARAAEIAPVTVPVVRNSALVLARCNQTDRALSMARGMFRYDPPAAARLLSALERLVGTDRASGAVPEEPDAWYAWSRQLRTEGETEQADTWLRDTHARWPGYLPSLRALVARALWRGDREELAALVPEGAEMHEGIDGAILYAARAFLLAGRGEVNAALGAIAAAEEQSGSSADVLVHTGAVLRDLGRVEEARSAWRRALYRLPSGGGGNVRTALLVRLARLEEEEGKLGEALRLWREVLEHAPDHGEATRRIEEITYLRR